MTDINTKPTSALSIFYKISFIFISALIYDISFICKLPENDEHLKNSFVFFVFLASDQQTKTY